MHDVILFAVLGLASGGSYALLGQGIVVIYKGSGVLNFGQGAVALIGAVALSDLQVWVHLPLGAAVAGALAISLVVGALIFLLIMRPLRTAPALARHVATLGLVVAIPAAVIATHPGVLGRTVTSLVPTEPITLFGIQVGRDRLYLLGIALVVTALVAALFRYTRFGLATRAVAESEFAASILGFSPGVIGLANWMLGCLLAGGAGMVIAPITGIDPTNIPFLVVPALAAALIGGFTSFWVTGVAALAIGLMQSEALRFWNQPGAQDMIPLLVIIVVMSLRNRALPTRDYILKGRPPISLAGRFRLSWAVGGIIVTLVVSAFLTGQYSYALQTSWILAIVLLSQTIVTGFVGQVSLAQMTFAGVGALVTARCASNLGVPFPLSIVIAAVVVAPVGVLLGLPAVRVRGINLAVVTLGLSVAISSFVFGNASWTGAPDLSAVPTPTIFGWSLSATAHGGRYAVVAVLALIVVAAVTTWIRRGAARAQDACRAGE